MIGFNACCLLRELNVVSLLVVVIMRFLALVPMEQEFPSDKVMQLYLGLQALLEHTSLYLSARNLILLLLYLLL